MSEKKETYKLFNLPWYYFAIFAVVVLIATYTGNLPKGMSGCFAFMIVLGTILYEIGEKTPIIRSYLGGGALLPRDLRRPDSLVCPVYGSGCHYGLRHHQGAAAHRPAHHGRRHGRRRSAPVQDI